MPASATPSANPLSLAGRRTPESVAERVAACMRADIRLLPAPFDAAMAIASDNDGATAIDHRAYTGLIVNRFGLDFGDSARFLHAAPAHGGGSAPDATPAAYPDELSFLRADGTPSTPVSPGFDDCIGTHDAAWAALRGDIDHIHGLSNEGPVAIVLARDVDVGPDGATASIADVGTPDAYVASLGLGALLVHSDVAWPPGATVTAIAHDGRTLGTVRDAGAEAPLRGAPALFRFDTPQPVGTIASLRIDGFRGRADSVLGVTVTARTVCAAIDHLRDEWSVEFPLFVDCSARVFLSGTSASGHARRCAELATSGIDRLSAALDDPPYSCLGDDPGSFCYVLPSWRRRGLRFVNPSGASGERHESLHLLELLAPTTARDGTGLYAARRLLTWLPRERATNTSPSDRGTRTFGLRLDSAIDAIEHETATGRAWPIYTHLGNVQPKSERPTPYLPLKPLERLQSAALGLPRPDGTTPRRRIWFTRASTLYDYALVLAGLPEATTRNGDRITVTSWHDDVLDARVPAHPSELNGATFFVDDERAATVSLDETVVPEIVRTPASEDEGSSVSVVGVHYVVTLLNDLTPHGSGLTAHEHDHAPSSVQTPASRRYHRVAPATTCAWTPDDLAAPGAQYVLVVCRAAHGDAQLELGITSGGIDFRFPVTSSAGAWNWHVVPLARTAWPDGACAGGPLPTHAIERIALQVTGAATGAVDIDRIALVRPGSRPGADRVRLGGRCVHADGTPVAGHRVTAIIDDGTAITAVSARDGSFVLPSVQRGTIVRGLLPRDIEAWDHLLAIPLQVTGGSAE